MNKIRFFRSSQVKSIRQWIFRSVTYAVGLFILACGVSLSATSNLGVTTITALPKVFSDLLHVDFGTATTAFFCSYVFIEILLLGKSFQWIQLLQIPCAVLFGKFVSLTGKLLSGIKTDEYLYQILLALLSALLIAIGIQLYLSSRLIPQAADGLVKAIAEKYGWKIANVKNIFDICSVILAIAVSYVAFGKVVGVREGTLISAICVGRVLAVMNRIEKRVIFEISPEE